MLRTISRTCCFAVMHWLLIISVISTAAAEVIIRPTPDGGVQPRMLVDSHGTVHLLYFKKRLSAPSAREGNLYYRQYLVAENRFGTPIKVSSQAFNVQTVSISRASMALDGAGRVHVIWYLPRAEQYYYARSNTQRNQFEPQQSMVSEYVDGIDAGAEIAAYGTQVAIVWGAGALVREYERTAFVRLSHDSGSSFGPEMMVSDPELGACACCSLASEYMSDSELIIAYRSALNGIGRHMQLLTLSLVDNEVSGAAYGPVDELQQWELSACPLSTNDIAIDANLDRWLIFETASRIVQKNLNSERPPSLVGEPFSQTRQKNPAVAFNNKGQRLIVWGEAISHSRGGRLNMRLFEGETAENNIDFTEEITIPNFSFPAAASLPNGDFLVLY